MSLVTAGFTTFLISIIVAIIIRFLFRRILRSIFKKLRRILFAWFVAKFAVWYNKRMDEQKKKLFSELRSSGSSAQDSKTSACQKPLNLLEIGAGSGANFQYYPEGALVTCVEPNKHFDGYLQKSLQDRGSHLLLLGQKVCPAEDMSVIDSESVDVVVCTLVLCSVDDVPQSLREIYRILKKGGKFLCMEHLHAEHDKGSKTRCHSHDGKDHLRKLDRHTLYQQLKSAGFCEINLEFFTADELLIKHSIFAPILNIIIRKITPHVRGIVIK